MPRENINPNPSIRQLETYNDFSGGVNSETSNERLKDNEFPVFDNVDLNGRGSARRRYGRDLLNSMLSGKTLQGSFFYFPSGQIDPDVIIAASGQLYLYKTFANAQAQWSVTNETPSGSGTNYTLAHPYVDPYPTVYVNGTEQTYVPNPSTAPIVSVITAPSGATIPLGNYQVGYTWTNSQGESEISPTVTVSVQPGEQIQIQHEEAPVPGVTVNYYLSVASDSNTLGFCVNSTALVNSPPVYLNALPATGAKNPPATNTATVYTYDPITGTITFLQTPAAIPTVSYTYQLQYLPISGLGSGFQTTRQISAVQYQGVLYIATGTKLCTYDGTTASVIAPYEPSPMEAIYIGVNSLADDPNNWIQDGTQGSGIEVSGVNPEINGNSMATMVVNQPITFTAFVNKASSITSVSYQFQYRLSVDPSTGQAPNAWTTGQAFSTTKSWTFTPTQSAPYDIQVIAEDTNNTTTQSVPYYLMSFPVASTPPTAPKDASSIHSCTEVAVYWDRLILANDANKPTQMYVSDLDSPNYFPNDFTIDWDNGRNEPITKLIQFRDSLFVFQKTSTQALKGSDPTSWQKVMVHPEYGAYAPRSVQVINDTIFFLSAEGIMAFQPNMFMTYYDIMRVDYPIRSEIINTLDADSSSAFYDNQYILCVPSQKRIYRYYFDYKAWVRDVSDVLNFSHMLRYGDSLYNVTSDSNLYQVNQNVYSDGPTVYTMKVQSKLYNFDEVFVQKKLKRMYLLAQNYTDHNVDLQVTVNADAAIVLNPEQGQATIDENGNVQWITTTVSNFQYYAGTSLGSWILGESPLGSPQISVQDASITGGTKVNRIRIVIEHSEPTMCEIFGYAFQFRLKRLR